MKAKTVFKIIDFSMDPIQNNGYKEFVKKNNISVEHDIVYDEDFPEIRVGDLYMKDRGGDTNTKLPVFINAHGGGFVAGDKKHRRYFSAYIAEIGYAVFNINYGVGPENKFPFCLQSIVIAMNWVEKNADKYNFDVSKVVLSGDSAGANIAALGAIAATNAEFIKSIDMDPPTIKPAAVLLYCGPYDIATAMNAHVPLLPDLIGNIIIESTGYKKEDLQEFKYLNQFSPIEYINEDYPKAFLVYSQKDFFCKNHGELLEKSLREHGVSVSSFHSTKLLDNHCFHLNHNFKEAKEALDKSKEFLLSVI
ncbi:MAG: alpha/beta hydrolase [Clostridiales bacterium]|jgi:acetyl esterase/lipase|nr:alpha/beta hydrolase [Clostridiales bacterium]